MVVFLSNTSITWIFDQEVEILRDPPGAYPRPTCTSPNPLLRWIGYRDLYPGAMTHQIPQFPGSFFVYVRRSSSQEDVHPWHGPSIGEPRRGHLASLLATAARSPHHRRRASPECTVHLGGRPTRPRPPRPALSRSRRLTVDGYTQVIKN